MDEGRDGRLTDSQALHDLLGRRFIVEQAQTTGWSLFTDASDYHRPLLAGSYSTADDLLAALRAALAPEAQP